MTAQGVCTEKHDSEGASGGFRSSLWVLSSSALDRHVPEEQVKTAETGRRLHQQPDCEIDWGRRE